MTGRTPFSSDNAAFSKTAHMAARDQVYPNLFRLPRNNLAFEDIVLGESERSTVLDGQMAIDRIVKVKSLSLNYPISFTIQERFRKKKFARYKDITITEWNDFSNLPSELYKLNANFFLYGYFDFTENVFLDVIVVDIPKMLLAICSQRLGFQSGRNPRSNQSFITIKFDALTKIGCVVYRATRN